MTIDGAGKPLPFEKDEEIEPDVAAWQKEVHEALQALPDGWERKFWAAFLQAASVETTRRWKDGVSLGEADHSVWTEPMYSAARMALLTRAAQLAVKQSWHVEDNMTGARASRDYESEALAVHACRALNIDAGPGGRFGVYDQSGRRV